MMAILKSSIEAFRSGGIPGVGSGAAETRLSSSERETSERSWQDEGGDERRSSHRSEEMFYWGMAGGPWY
ncbi:hypothetical protein C8J34_102979 [Rhizobium sp. PP-F2F-G36]|nr:hypothetical protein C8J34_102979 [Rhizobium sp. PP-F2F-G36]